MPFSNHVYHYDVILMNEVDTALARNRTYQLFSHLFLNGVTTDLLPYINAVPELASTITLPLDQDDAAAEHYQIFSYDIFPYESMFRDPSGLLGGCYTESVRAYYRDTAMQITIDEDHIGQEFSFMAALCEAELKSLRINKLEEASRYAHFQYQFLRDHLLTWLPALAASLALSEHAFYSVLGQLALELVYDHWDSTTNPCAPASMDPCAHDDLPQLNELLENKKTSMRQIAGHLISPPRSGFYMGREVIAKFARQHQLPRGFGSRQQMLANLFGSAAQYELIPMLTQNLIEYCGLWKQQYEQQSLLFPQMNAHLRPWITRVSHSSSALVIMQDSIVAWRSLV